MTDRELMLHRFYRKNIRKTTAKLARELGIDKKVYEAAVMRGLKAENSKRNDNGNSDK